MDPPDEAEMLSDHFGAVATALKGPDSGAGSLAELHPI